MIRDNEFFKVGDCSLNYGVIRVNLVSENSDVKLREIKFGIGKLVVSLV